jgi:phage-related protein
MDIFGGLFVAIYGIFTGDGALIVEGFKQIWEGCKELFQGFYDVTIGAAWDFVKTIIDYFKKLYDELVGHSIVPDIINGIIGWFGKLPGKILEFLNSIWESIKDKFGKMKETISSIGSSISNSVKDTWSGIKNTVSDIASKLWDSAKGGFDNMKNNIKNWVNDMGKVWDVAKEWGSHLMENFAKGVKDSINKVKEEIEGVKDWIKDKLGFSYNKYMPTEVWGKHMVENFAKGVEDSTSIFEDAFGGLQDIVNNGLNMPIMNTAASASSSMAASDSRTTKKEASNVVTQNSGNTYNIQPGTMIASQGEIREFVRLLNKYQATEAARKI